MGRIGTGVEGKLRERFKGCRNTECPIHATKFKINYLQTEKSIYVNKLGVFRFCSGGGRQREEVQRIIIFW